MDYSERCSLQPMIHPQFINHTWLRAHHFFALSGCHNINGRVVTIVLRLGKYELCPMVVIINKYVIWWHYMKKEVRSLSRKPPTILCYFSAPSSWASQYNSWGWWSNRTAGALPRWMIAAPEIARMVSEFESSKTNNTRRHEQTKNTQEQFAKNVRSLDTTIEQICNPFKMIERVY